MSYTSENIFGSDTWNKQQKVGADFGATMWLECKD